MHQLHSPWIAATRPCDALAHARFGKPLGSESLSAAYTFKSVFPDHSNTEIDRFAEALRISSGDAVAATDAVETGKILREADNLVCD